MYDLFPSYISIPRICIPSVGLLSVRFIVLLQGDQLGVLAANEAGHESQVTSETPKELSVLRALGQVVKPFRHHECWVNLL